MADLPSSRQGFWLKDNEYELETKVGEGRYAEVWKATERVTGKLLAVKVFKRGKDPKTDVGYRFIARHEELLLHACEGMHHILQAGAIRYLKDGRRSVEIPMDFYAYDLSYLMNQTKETRGLCEKIIVAPTWYYTVLTQMLEALEYLHSELRPLIHRDIRPNNILYNNINHFVLADFTDAAVDRGHAGEFTSPLEYLPPEMYNRDEQTEAVDIWSLGVLCLHMLDLVPGVSKKNFCFEKMKERSWCAAMCEFAKYCTRPEVWMMLQMNPLRRSKARLLLRFLQDNPSSQLQRQPASEHLIYLIFKELKQFKGYPKSAIFKAAGEFLRDEIGSSATASVGRSADEAKSESEPMKNQGRSRPSNGPSGLLSASAALSPMGPEGLDEQILIDSSGAAAKSLPTRSPGAPGSSSSTLHKVPKELSNSGSTPPLAKPHGRAGASTTSRQPKNCKPAPLALTLDEQRLVDELGSVAPSRPSSSAESKSKMRRQRRVPRPSSPKGRKKAAEPSATTMPPWGSGASAGPSSSTINPQPTSSQEEAERSGSINMLSKGLEALTVPSSSPPKSSSVPRGTAGAPSSVEKPSKRSERAAETSSPRVKPQLNRSKGETESNSNAESPPRRLQDEAEKPSSTSSPQSVGSQVRVSKSSSIAKPSPNSSKTMTQPTSSVAKMPAREPRDTTGPASSISKSTSESAGSKKGEQGSSKVQGINQALEAVKVSDEAARKRREPVVKEAKTQALKPARTAPAVNDQQKSVLKKAEIQVSEPTQAPPAAMPPPTAKNPPTAWGKSIAKKAEAQASEPARAPLTATEQQKSVPKNAEAQTLQAAKTGESMPAQRDEVQAPLVFWRGRPRELVQETARGSSQAISRDQSHPATATQSRSRAKSTERPPSESSPRTSTSSSPRRGDKPDSTLLTPSIGPHPPRGLSVDAPKWNPGTNTWGLSKSEPPKRTFAQAAGSIPSAAPRPSEAETQGAKVERGEGEAKGERLQHEEKRSHRPSGSQSLGKQSESQSQSPSQRNQEMEPRRPRRSPPHHHHPPPPRPPGNQRRGSYPPSHHPPPGNYPPAGFYAPHPPPGNISGGFDPHPPPASPLSQSQAYHYRHPYPLPSPGSYPGGYYYLPPP